MFKLSVLVILIAARETWSQDEEGPYRGKLIGKLNTYHHQVSGDVYAVDDWTILLVDFNYDGTGEDTFFWAGDTGRPGPQGFIVPDEHGKTNILARYHSSSLRLSLPDGKRLSRLKWLAVYDIGSQNSFGDVFVPDDFDPPAPRRVPALAGPGAASQPLEVLDACTLRIPEFRYDGSGEEVYFWTGSGAQPSPHGRKVPDQYGYLEPLSPYSGEDVTLQLPGGLTVFEVDWLAVYDVAAQRSLAATLLPKELNVPPANVAPSEHKSSLANCRQLHRDYQVAWEVFGNQITIELTGQIGPDEYMSFGISGSELTSRMMGADVAVVHYSQAQQRGLAIDYNITAMAPCVQVLGQWRGVCRDTLVGGLDSNQVFTAERKDGLTRVSYRRTLNVEDAVDLPWETSRPARVVWAVGALDGAGEPGYHRLHPHGDVALRLVPAADASPQDRSDCFPFVLSSPAPPGLWEVAQLFDPALRVFRFTVGPAGGRRGLRGRPGRGAAPAAAWYVNGQLAPDLQLLRGRGYSLQVWGGNDPHSAEEYHPLVITTDPDGGLERLTEAEQRAAASGVLAGVIHPRRGRLHPAAAGPLCRARRPAQADARRDDDYASFRSFNRSLVWECPESPPAELSVTPNSSWPDLVYYNSFTHAGMGGRIFVVDRHQRRLGRGAVAAPRAALSLTLTLAAGALLPLGHRLFV